MKEAQDAKWVLLIPPQVADGAAFARPAAADVRGFGYAEFYLATGAAADVVGESGTSLAPKLEECDTDSVTAGDWTAIPNAQLAAVIPATNDKQYKIDIDLMNSVRKPFIRPKALTAGATGAGVALCGVCRLSKPQMGMLTAAQRGLAENVIV